jgi:hypothetical protein
MMMDATYTVQQNVGNQSSAGAKSLALPMAIQPLGSLRKMGGRSGNCRLVIYRNGSKSSRFKVAKVGQLHLHCLWFSSSYQFSKYIQI